MPTRIGQLEFIHGHGTMIDPPIYDPIAAIVQAGAQTLGFPDDDLVALGGHLTPEASSLARHYLPHGAKLGLFLNACLFDPPSDHPEGFEFDYLPAVIFDFVGINDDLGRADQVLGGHFSRLLSWQPRIDHKRTTLMAQIQPEDPEEFEIRWKDRDAAPMVAEQLAASGYDAVILAGRACSEEEIALLAGYATEMRRGALLPAILATSTRLAVVPEPFIMNFTTQHLGHYRGDRGQRDSF